MSSAALEPSPSRVTRWSWLRRLLQCPLLCAVRARLTPRRVPLRLQMTQTECGAACLAAVHTGWTDELRELLPGPTVTVH